MKKSIASKLLGHMLSGLALLGVFIGLSCSDIGVEGPYGDYLFLEAAIFGKEYIIEGNPGYIPRQICPARPPCPAYLPDFGNRSLRFICQPRFEVSTKMVAIIGELDERFCDDSRAYPLFGFPLVIEDSVSVLGVVEDAGILFRIRDREVVLRPGELKKTYLRMRRQEGTYTIPPDTVRYRYVVEFHDTVSIVHHGLWPRDQVLFEVN